MEHAIEPSHYPPLLNEPAPTFKAQTTHGTKTLADFKGSWLVLFSHPGDFTPVCTSEFVGFAQSIDKFNSLNTKLMGLSIDSLFSHLAWIRDIYQKFNVKITFPIIADSDMKIAKAYGMNRDAIDTQTVRATFVIDPKGVLRAVLHYPMSTGRSVGEILRLVTALQMNDVNDVFTAEGWELGDKVIVPPPTTASAAESRIEEGYECIDWYFCQKNLRKL